MGKNLTIKQFRKMNSSEDNSSLSLFWNLPLKTYRKFLCRVFGRTNHDRKWMESLLKYSDADSSYICQYYSHPDNPRINRNVTVGELLTIGSNLIKIQQTDPSLPTAEIYNRQNAGYYIVSELLSLPLYYGFNERENIARFLNNDT